MKMNRASVCVRLAGLIGVVSLFAFPAASAEAPATEKSALVKFFEQDYLLGDWGGLRTDLHNRGVDFEFL